MDRRACPSYEAGLGSCDPLGSVFEWSGRGESPAPARVLRRRCRSEGLERPVYEDAYLLNGQAYHAPFRVQPNKSHFTLNNTVPDRLHHECLLATTHNGDYLMAHDQHKFLGYQPGRSKFNRCSPTRTYYTKAEDSRLPKVEELFEKLDHDMEMNHKQPLKSILNHPAIPRSPPHSILKKPKTRNGLTDVKTTPIEGRRRQRASSESDNYYGNLHLSTPLSYESRLNYFGTNTKRARDNSGTGYSYGSALATVSSASKEKKYASKEPVNGKDEKPHVLRTTAITNETRAKSESKVELVTDNIRLEHSPTAPAPSPTEAVSQPVTPQTTPRPITMSAKKKAKAKTKKPKSPSVRQEFNLTNLHDGDKRTPVSPARRTSPSPLRRPSPSPATRASPTRLSPTRLSPSPSPPPSPLRSTAMMETELVLQELAQSVARYPPAPAPSSPLHALTRHSHVSPVTPLNTHATVAPVAVRTRFEAQTKVKNNVKEEKDKEKDKEREKEKPETVKDSKSKDAFFLASLMTTSMMTKKQIANTSHKDFVTNLPDNVATCIRKSIFPRVPPYIRFIGHDEVLPLRVPAAIANHLKWKLTTITPIVVKKTLVNSGFRLVKSDCDTAENPQEETVEWIGIWGKHMKSIMFKAIKDGQKMNHFPGTFQIGRKDRLWRNLQKLTVKFGKDEFGIMPLTYVLPKDMKLLKHNWENHAVNNEKWIIKPPASARGTGIKVVSRWTQIPKKRAVVVQRYVSKPYLINGSKFDLRLYVLVTSIHPLRIYLYKDGLARFASVKYNDEVNSLHDRYMHLTNYSINRLSKNYTPNEDFAACEGHKWTLLSLLHYLKTEKKVDTVALWDALKDLVVKTIIAGEASISSLTKTNITSRYNCYELFGVDVLLDENLKPWLLEVNISPSLHSASPLDIHVKGPMVTTVLNIAQYQVPMKINLESLTRDRPHKLVSDNDDTHENHVDDDVDGGLPYDSRLYTVYLSKEERDKHIIYTNMDDRDMYLRDILSTLTPDDVRHLIQAEDEFTQSGDMERIFPTADTHRYLPFLSGPRYYNRLFDAWETRYAKNRDSGLQLLKNLCEIGYHLEVPPIPLKNDVDAPSPEVSAPPSYVSLEVVATPSRHSQQAGDALGPKPDLLTA